MSKITDKIKRRVRSLGSRLRLFFQIGYFSNKFSLWLLALGLLANLAGWISIRIFINPAVSTIILHYNVYFGVDMKGEPRQAYFLPLIALVIYLVNFVLSFYFYAKKERIAAHILLMASLMVQLSAMISIGSMIIINY